MCVCTGSLCQIYFLLWVTVKSMKIPFQKHSAAHWGQLEWGPGAGDEEPALIHSFHLGLCCYPWKQRKNSKQAWKTSVLT